MYCVLQLLAGCGTGGMLNVIYTFVVEMTNTDNRMTVTLIFSNGASIGLLILTLIAYFVSH